MARYVLLSFDDNAEAERFIEAVKQRDVFFSAANPNGEGGSYGYFSDNVFTRAVWGKPVKFCECTNPGDNSVLGAKFGWWVHRPCGRPKKGQWQHPKNLIEPLTHPRERSAYLGIEEPTRPTVLERLGTIEPIPPDQEAHFKGGTDARPT